MNHRCAGPEYRLIAFDLDDTLAHSKAAVEPEMISALYSLLRRYEVLVISGAMFRQFEVQLLEFMGSSGGLSRLHLMPTCGTRYMRWHSGGWIEEYAHGLSISEKVAAAEAVERVAKGLGYWGDDDVVWGERIEDRGSQITYSALGQLAPVGAKRKWDPSGEKRERLRAALEPLLPDLEVRAGGATSIDVTRKGIDKAYGLAKLMSLLDLAPREVLFVGDRLEPGGNDYPVTALGVDVQAVAGPEETLAFIATLVGGTGSS